MRLLARFAWVLTLGEVDLMPVVQHSVAPFRYFVETFESKDGTAARHQASQKLEDGSIMFYSIPSRLLVLSNSLRTTRSQSG